MEKAGQLDSVILSAEQYQALQAGQGKAGRAARKKVFEARALVSALDAVLSGIWSATTSVRHLNRHSSNALLGAMEDPVKSLCTNRVHA